MKIFYSIILIAALSIIPYLNSLNNDFVWDDVDLIRDNPDLKNFKNLPHLFSSPFGNPVQFNENPLFYRPLVFASYMIEYKLYGLNPFFYHLTNIILHTVSSVLIFFMLLKIFSDINFSLLSSLIFAIHPIHTESVTWISGRTDVLCTVFLLASFISCLNFLNAKGRACFFYYSISVFFFTLSIFSKETSLVLLLIIFFYEKFFLLEKNSFFFSIKSCFKKYYVFAFPIAFYAILRTYALEKNIYFSLTNSSLTERFLTMFSVFFDYIKLLLFPINLNSLYIVNPVSSVFNFKLLLSILALILIFLAMAGLRKSHKKFFFGSLWFFISLLPVSNIIPFSSIIKTEHFLYLPSVGFSVVAGMVLFEMRKQESRVFSRFLDSHLKIISLSLTIIIILLFSIQTITRNNIWKDEITLFQNQVLKTPFSPIPHNNLGIAFKASGNFALAEKEFLISKKLNPKQHNTYINLGNLYMETGNFTFAVKNYKIAIEINPSNASAHNSLGVVYAKTGNMQNAINEFKISSELNPQYASPFANLGNVYINLNEHDKAINALKKAIEINPYLPAPRLLLGAVYKNIGKKDMAIKELMKSLELDPENIKVYMLLRNIYLEKGDFSESLKFYNMALSITRKNGIDVMSLR